MIHGGRFLRRNRGDPDRERIQPPASPDSGLSALFCWQHLTPNSMPAPTSPIPSRAVSQGTLWLASECKCRTACPLGREHHGERGVKTNDSVDDVTKQSGPYNSVPGTPEGSRRPETSAFPSVHHDDADSRRRAGRSIGNAPRAQRCGSETPRPGWAGGHMQATGPNLCSSPSRGFRARSSASWSTRAHRFASPPRNRAQQPGRQCVPLEKRITA